MPFRSLTLFRRVIPSLLAAALAISPALAVDPGEPTSAPTASDWPPAVEPELSVPVLPFYLPLTVVDGEPKHGATSPNLYRRFSLSLGTALYRNFDTSLTVSSDALAGAVLDLEDTLGVSDHSSVFRLDTYYSFSPRHRLDFSYYAIDRNGRRSIPNDINVGEVVIPAGSVDTTFDTTIFKLAYRYNFVADERTVVGASFGFHTMQFDTSIGTSNNVVEETFKAIAPLPVLGLHGEYALSDKWRLLASAEFLQVDLGSFRGVLVDQRLSIEHDTFEHVGWGLGFNSFNLSANVQDDPLSADIEYAFQGLMLYLRTSF